MCSTSHTRAAPSASRWGSCADAGATDSQMPRTANENTTRTHGRGRASRFMAVSILEQVQERVADVRVPEQVPGGESSRRDHAGARQEPVSYTHLTLPTNREV